MKKEMMLFPHHADSNQPASGEKTIEQEALIAVQTCQTLLNMDDRIHVGGDPNKKITSLINSLNPAIFASTDCAQKIHALYKKSISNNTSSPTEKFKSYLDIRAANLKIIEVLLQNPENIPYLTKEIRAKNLPEPLLRSYREFCDANEYEDPGTCAYFYDIATLLEQQPQPQAAELLEYMLAEVQKQYTEYAKQIHADSQPTPYDDLEDFDTDDKMFSHNEEYGHFLYRRNLSFLAPEQIIQSLASNGRRESIPVIVDFLKNENIDGALYLENASKVLKHINQRQATIELLELAKSEDPIERRLALSILYRTEDQQIGVGPDGLAYLQKRYDLGTTYNNEAYSGQRITNQGHVGIFENSSKKLEKFFVADGLDAEDITIKAKLLDITYENLFTPLPGETSEERTEREKFLNNFQNKYSDFFNNDFFETTGLHFNDLSFAEQGAFMRLYEQSSEAQRKDLGVFGLAHGLGGLRALLAMQADTKTQSGHAIIDACKQLPPRTAEKIFNNCGRILSLALFSADTVQDEIQAEFPEAYITADQIRYGLLARTRDYFLEMIAAINKDSSNSDEIINQYIFELSNETLSESVFKSTFKSIGELLGRQDIDLHSLKNEQTLALAAFNKPRNKTIAFRTLQRMDKLEPIPEIHWRVDRDTEDYKQRLGFDINAYLRNRITPTDSTKPILLEIGPGSGAHKQERSLSVQGYEDYSLSDKIYYPLAPVIKELLDTKALAKAIAAPLSDQEIDTIADILYKTLIIKQGQTNKEHVEYDTDIQAKIQRDLNSLHDLLPTLGDKLHETTSVPNTISTRDAKGNVIYPYKINRESLSPNTRAALTAIENNPKAFLKANSDAIDCYQLINAFTPNTIIGDISDIKRLADNQIDVELAVRSTVYSRGENYIEFLKDLSAKLRDGGVAIDDSIRDNDGWYYRFAEISKALKQIPDKLEIMIVLGPGFPGEDKRQERVPLAMVITKNGSSKESVLTHLNAGNELVPFETLLEDTDYLRSLDDSGLTASNIER